MIVIRKLSITERLRTNPTYMATNTRTHPPRDPSSAGHESRSTTTLPRAVSNQATIPVTTKTHRQHHHQHRQIRGLRLHHRSSPPRRVPASATRNRSDDERVSSRAVPAIPAAVLDVNGGGGGDRNRRARRHRGGQRRGEGGRGCPRAEGAVLQGRRGRGQHVAAGLGPGQPDGADG